MPASRTMRVRRLCLPLLAAAAAAGIATIVEAASGAIPAPGTRVGHDAYGDWQSDAPGVVRLITPGDMPRPFATLSAGNGPDLVDPPKGAAPRVPKGFHAHLFASRLENPRQLRVAPNGDIFIAESQAGRVRVLRARDGADKSEENRVFAEGLTLPFGMAFYPPGPEPKYLYVANTDSVVRFPYENGDLKARGAAEVVVQTLPASGGHWTRDIAFSPDGARMFVSVGSGSNDAEGIAGAVPTSIADFEAKRAPGAAWGAEENRADVLTFDPGGGNGHIFATGLRNCVSMAVQPGTGTLWCATNERDGMGDDLPPDYVTRVREHAFYGWPWYYIGNHEDPRHKGERPDLADRVTVPDVLLQPHSAPLGLAFYDAAAFPAEYRGSAFVALHGSWNRAKRTGYKIVRIVIRDGAPTGEYEDFMTGFVASAAGVWGRPVGVGVAHDGALLVSEDGNGTVWRISYKP